MDQQPHASDRTQSLLAAAHRRAASALEAHPPSEWGEAVAAALSQSLADECNPEVLARLRALSEREE